MNAEQRTLFEVEPAPWDMDASGEQLVATLVFPSGPTQEFDYLVPDRLRGQVEPGRRMTAPFGGNNRPVVGYCLRVETRPASHRRLKEVAAVVDTVRLLSPAMLRLTEWIAERYLCPLGQVLESVLPAAVRGEAGTRLTTLFSVAEEVRSRRQGLKLSGKQAEILDYLIQSELAMTASELTLACQCTLSPLQALRRKGLLQATTRRVLRGALSPEDKQLEAQRGGAAREAHLQLNDDQQAALQAILTALAAGRHETLLLHGITGSGKTEVYMQAIAEMLRYGRQAIVLVPEISLTPQTKERFRARFGEVAVLHSHLTDVERNVHWQRIARGEVHLVVGARSAVFAPTPHLGLIVMDEEHEGSFKQDSAPRYHAREVAMQRAMAEKIPLVLGSATPSLESWHHAQTGGFRWLRLPRRVMNRPLPRVHTVDLRQEFGLRRARGAISRPLANAMRETLEAGNQVMLLLNRRGFSTHIQCPACGTVVRCPSCEIALTHHRPQSIALCHYCDFQVPAPTKCPNCEFTGIRYSGIGTQQLEAEVRSGFPEYTCQRMDTDTMRHPKSHEEAFEAFRTGKTRILLGTQMIAKGLDFPDVTLVGVVNADLALHLPDFRAAERTFQLLVQVAGRTGRGDKGGEVLVQTLSPDHPAIRFAIRHDYEGFAAAELPMREALGYPPYASMVRIVVRGPVLQVTQGFAEHLGQLLRAEMQVNSVGGRILGPVPAPLPKLRDNYRFQLQLQGPDSALLRNVVRESTAKLKPPDEVQWMVDVDPLDML